MISSEEQVKAITSELSKSSREITVEGDLSIRATLALVAAVQEITFEVSEIKRCLLQHLPDLQSLRGRR